MSICMYDNSQECQSVKFFDRNKIKSDFQQEFISAATCEIYFVESGSR